MAYPGLKGPGFSIGGQDRMAKRRQRGMEFFGRGQQPLSYQLGGLESAVSSQRGLEPSPDRPKVSTVSSTQDDLSRHYNIVSCGL